jgi:hypothetical protein
MDGLIFSFSFFLSSSSDCTSSEVSLISPDKGTYKCAPVHAIMTYGGIAPLILNFGSISEVNGNFQAGAVLLLGKQPSSPRIRME